ncbi:NAD(P)H:quinone oxidoreductase [Roseovarius sp. SK2]|uniref:NAD(P)H:quinone oxidoreductase n=1 Tax=Roseovarius TaxID=74030 RepID=UPI00237C0866|nr:NAD(P)H:quinone oxidoreductase [Roseovarius sp. SK2]MDD9727124.1 NAD(P)H:quinone oxidoreductase [Roseovarius sp. SK2]
MTDQDPVRLAIVYYSSTSNTFTIAQEIAAGAEKLGAAVRIRRVAELAPDAAIDATPAWRKHLEATREVPVATHSDLEWADGFVFGTPTRFGLPAAQLKQFLDTCGGLWMNGKLTDKVVSAFTGAGNVHGGQESTLLALHNVFYHWGAIMVPPGYTNPAIHAAGGNPYGTSFTDGQGAPLSEATLRAARHQGARMATWAQAVRRVRAA